MDNNEIKKANRKALPMFLLVLAVSLAVGGFIGFFSAKYGLNELAGGMKSAGRAFGMRVAPWLLLAEAVLLPVVAIPLYGRVKKLLAAWDGEDEALSDQIDARLSVILWISSAALIVSYFLLAASYSGGFAIFEDKSAFLPLVVSIGAFLAVMGETVVLQQRCVDGVKKTNPEKTASVYDMKFQKKWMDSCDEAEKLLIGKCAAKAYQAVNATCTALAVVFAVGAILFDIGFLPSLAVCLVWLVSQCVYCRECLRYSRAGKKIS